MVHPLRKSALIGLPALGFLKCNMSADNMPKTSIQTVLLAKLSSEEGNFTDNAGHTRY